MSTASLQALALVALLTGCIPMSSSADLPDPAAVTVSGTYQPGTPCHAIRTDDGRTILLPARTRLIGIPAGGRVTAMGERMEHDATCGGPVLILRSYFAPDT